MTAHSPWRIHVGLGSRHLDDILNGRASREPDERAADNTALQSRLDTMEQRLSKIDVLEQRLNTVVDLMYSIDAKVDVMLQIQHSRPDPQADP